MPSLPALPPLPGVPRSDGRLLPDALDGALDRAVDREAVSRAADRVGVAAAAAGEAAGAAAEALSAAATVAAEVALAGGRDLARGLARTAERLPAPAALDGVLEDAVSSALDRGGLAWDALRGHRPPRRWPWALGSAVAGAAVAGGVAVLLRRLRTSDAPGSVEPEQVRAVVDPAPAGPEASPVPAGPVDEDGEAVLPAD